MRVFHARTFTALPLCIALVACIGPDEPPEATVTGSEDALFSTADTVLWNNASKNNQGPLGTNVVIPVCFAVRPSPRCPQQTSRNVDCEGRSTNPFNSLTLNSTALRATIRRLVENTWARAANIEFVNWGDCKVDPATNKHVDSQLANTIVIQFQQEFDPPAGLICSSDANCGATPHAQCKNGVCVAGGVDWSGVGKFSNGPTVIQYNWPPIQAGADFRNLIHEFGHALGFAHEWMRNNFTDPACSMADFPDRGSVSNGLALTTFPDASSIMNYCGNPTSDADRLSPGDLVGVQRAYGRKSSGSLVSTGGMCADIREASPAFGTPIIAYPCRNAANDRWLRDGVTQHLQATASDGSPRCLNVSGGTVSPTSPTPIISWSCVSNSNEDFSFSGVEWHGMGNMCATSVNNFIQMRPCDGSQAQKWTFLNSDPNVVPRLRQIQSNFVGLCVTTGSSTGALGERLHLDFCSTVDARQRFNFPGQGVIGFGNFCMNVLGGLPNAGSELGLWDGCTAVPRFWNEQFSLSGNVKVLGQCLDGSNTSQVSVSPCSSGNANQSWEYYL